MSVVTSHMKTISITILQVCVATEMDMRVAEHQANQRVGNHSQSYKLCASRTWHKHRNFAGTKVAASSQARFCHPKSSSNFNAMAERCNRTTTMQLHTGNPSCKLLKSREGFIRADFGMVRDTSSCTEMHHT